jgi:molybdenum cofactor biosynthesis enzyme MoaA
MLTLPEFPNDPEVRDLTLALNYRCNSQCRFCFIEPEIAAGAPDTPLEVVEEVFRRNAATRAFERIIFSGAEATLRPDLPAIVAGAHERGHFEHVRIQTNARRLKDRAYAEQLLSAGLGEYFVSIHAPRSELDAYLTGANHGFGQMRAGVQNLLQLGARVISNSVVTQDNYRELPKLARFLLSEGVRESELWSFIEFGAIGQEHQHVRHDEALPYLLEAVGILRSGGSTVRISWFPECLLGEHADLIANHRAFTLILDAFKRRMHENAKFSCPHATTCPRFSRSCVGLHERYVALYGDERETLVPFGRPG